MSRAMQIYAAFVDEGTALIWEGAFERLSERALYPVRLSTPDAAADVATAAAFARLCADFRAELTRLGATRYVRLPQIAEFDADDPDCIHGRHTTHILRGGLALVEPFENQLTLRRMNGRWLAAAMRSFVPNHDVTLIPAEPKSAASAATHDQEKDTDT